MAVTVSKLNGGPYSLQSATIAGIAKYGATCVLTRVGGNAADTLAGDISLAAVHAVRVS